jgi:hypothetical protein
MKCLGKTYSNSIFSEIACLDCGQKAGLNHALGKGAKKEISWASFIIRNDFGVIAEKHETIDKSSLLMRML